MIVILAFCEVTLFCEICMHASSLIDKANGGSYLVNIHFVCVSSLHNAFFSSPEPLAQVRY